MRARAAASVTGWPLYWISRGVDW